MGMARESRGLVDLTVRSALTFDTVVPLAAFSLGTSRSLLLASPDYLRRHGTPRHPSELVLHACIGLADPDSGRIWEWYFRERGHHFQLDPGCWMTTNRGSMLLDAALNGLGIVTELECNVVDYLSRGLLTAVLEPLSFRQSVGWVSHDRSRMLSAAAQSFLDFLKTRVGPHKASD